MICVIDTPLALVAYTPIVATSRSHRQAEREAVAAIVRHLYGCRYRLDHAADGAPVLVGCDAYISVTHSRDLAMVAVNPAKPVGIDAEIWRPALQRVAERFLTPRQLALCLSPQLLLQAWTLKEAVYKASPSPSPDLREIALADDMLSASDRAGKYDVHTLSIGQNTISIALLKS